MSSDSDAAAEERRKRAQARKDKIASRGADRLAKITGAARGDGEAGERFGTGGQQCERVVLSAASSDTDPDMETDSHKLRYAMSRSQSPSVARCDIVCCIQASTRTSFCAARPLRRPSGRGHILFYGFADPTRRRRRRLRSLRCWRWWVPLDQRRWIDARHAPGSSRRRRRRSRWSITLSRRVRSDVWWWCKRRSRSRCIQGGTSKKADVDGSATTVGPPDQHGLAGILGSLCSRASHPTRLRRPLVELPLAQGLFQHEPDRLERLGRAGTWETGSPRFQRLLQGCRECMGGFGERCGYRGESRSSSPVQILLVPLFRPDMTWLPSALSATALPLPHARAHAPRGSDSHIQGA